MLNVNEYFDGQVKSLSGFAIEQLNASCGVMLAGEYRFNTQSREYMRVLNGSMRVQIGSDTASWQQIQAGSEFCVPANSFFTAQIDAPCIYLCRYE